MLNDLVHALRLVRRQPGFTAIACVTLALGIGANTAIFSVVDAALFQPLPYRDADRLVSVYFTTTSMDGRTVMALVDGSQADYVRAASGVFEGVEVFGRPAGRALSAGSGPNVWVGAFSAGLPTFLGIAPEVGRTFTVDDVAAGDTIVLSDRFWRSALNGDPQVLGRTMAFAERSYTVIGVMPPTFRFFAGASADAWLPIGNRDGDDLVARLRPGVPLTEAKRELDAVSSRTTGRQLDWKIEPAGWNRVADTSRQMLLMLLGAVGFVLLIACANVANLLLTRTLVRQREIAVRASLGATRWQLVRQFLVEGLVLGAMGGVAAIVLARVVIRAVPAVMPGKLIQSLLAVSVPVLDARALAFGVVCALVTGVLCGLVPAARAAGSTALSRFLTAGSRTVGPSRAERRARAGFQALQVALTLVLLVGAGLLVTSFLRMRLTPPGFAGDRLSYITLTIPFRSFSPPQASVFADEFLARVQALPGVAGAAIGAPPAAGPSVNTQPITSDGDAPRTISARTHWFFVGAGYFQVAGIPLAAGRSFAAGETFDRPGVTSAAIISDNLARQLWPEQSAIGHTFRLGGATYSVVGIVPHLKTVYLADDDVQVFLPTTHITSAYGLIVRTAGGATMSAETVREVVRAIDSRVTLRRIGTVDALVDELDPLGSPRLYAGLMGALGVLGLLTAAVGLFGLLSHAVSQRTREIGVRLALGADASSVRRLVMRGALGPLAIGVVAGLIASWWMSRWLSTQLFHVAPHDPATLAGVVTLVVIVCGLAATLPAARAGRVNPVDALRAD
ncbi:MAG TPA: ADOP family duplicated permease [Vicinamibacterales bacterium]|nr:ADOP family duplicated permease [Vicinamibacterales bacterium]